jgi:hypothetical protein
LTVRDEPDNMVDAEQRDGRRIAELLASEIDGRTSGPLARLTVTDPDRSVEGTVDGERAYDVRALQGARDPRRIPGPEEAGALLGRVFVHPDRTRVALFLGLDAGRDAAEAAGLRARPAATTPPRTLVFVERAADVKRASDVFEAAADAATSAGLDGGDPAES